MREYNHQGAKLAAGSQAHWENIADLARAMSRHAWRQAVAFLGPQPKTLRALD